MMEFAVSDIISGLAVVIAVVTFFLRGSKDQSQTDKDQDKEIANLKADIKVLHERTNKLEGRLGGLETKLSEEIKNLEGKIDGIPEKIVSLLQMSKQ